MARGLVMGILNVTPDSFSDGGLYLDRDHAVARGLEMVDEGADVVDVGGESTRPGAEPVATGEELRRVVPVVKALAPHVRVSVDTSKPEVARAAVAAGASLINDVSGSLDAVAAELGAGWIAMHMQGTPRTMQLAPHYDDVVAEVLDWLASRAERAAEAGVGEVWIDPGIGFGKDTSHNLALLAHLDRFTATGHPVVVGVSRKRFVGELHGRSDGSGRPTDVHDRREGSVALATWAYARGAGMMRVHDVRATVHAAKVVAH